MDTLPPELLHNVLAQLPERDIARCACTNRAFWGACEDQQLWYTRWKASLPNVKQIHIGSVHVNSAGQPAEPTWSSCGKLFYGGLSDRLTIQDWVEVGRPCIRGSHFIANTLKDTLMSGDRHMDVDYKRLQLKHIRNRMCQRTYTSKMQEMHAEVLTSIRPSARLLKEMHHDLGFAIGSGRQELISSIHIFTQRLNGMQTELHALRRQRDRRQHLWDVFNECLRLRLSRLS